MKMIQINAYDYKELSNEAKRKALIWLDDYPYDYETGEVDEQGKFIKKYDYVSDWDEDIIKDHCEANEYLFDIYGNPIHHLYLNKSKEVA
jgi:hypothetical protein